MSLEEFVADTDKIVLKFGTNSLTKGTGNTLNMATLASIARFTDYLYTEGKKPLIVTSGAVASGMELYGLTERPTDPTELQDLSAEGFRELWNAYANAFSQYGINTVYLPVTSHSFRTHEEITNIRQIIERSWQNKRITLWNTNDALTNEELVKKAQISGGYSDNDPLAKDLAICILADGLAFFTDEGIHGTGGGYSKKTAIDGARERGISVAVFSIDEVTTFK
ncbi:MAG: hypothetical protein AABX51_02010 [Nanoarchaeota archaeon]